jgi:chromosome segregation ATPase
MDPVVSKALEELLKKMDNYDARSAERWGRLEKRVDDAEASLREREVAVDSRLTSLEGLVSAQYTAAAVADNWGSHFEVRLEELDQRMGALELIRLAEIHDERDDRVEDLEGAVGVLQSWRQEIEGHVDDLRFDLRRFSRELEVHPQRHPLPKHRESAAAAYSGGATVDWPNGPR